MRALLIAILALTAVPPLPATTWYVGPGGGTAKECTGTTDADYPGKGRKQPCRLSHPFWLIASPFTSASEGSWTIAGGDTVIFKNGVYQIGFGAPGTGWGTPIAAQDIHDGLPEPPAGPDPAHPTRFLGEEFATGCGHHPVLWGAGGILYVWWLGGPIGHLQANWTNPGNSNLDFECMEITDHDSCTLTGGPVICHDGYSGQIPTAADNWARTAFGGHYLSGLTMKYVDVHGMASTGISVSPVQDLSADHIRITANSGAGWNLDPGWSSTNGIDPNNPGHHHFTNFEIGWNGCTEVYSPSDSLPRPYDIRQAGSVESSETVNGCNTNENGYADGIGTSHTSGTWVFSYGVVQYNMQDGIDLLYCDKNINCSTQVDHVYAHSNGGQAIKQSNNSLIFDNVLVGDCRAMRRIKYWPGATGQPFNDANTCRAGGGPLAYSGYLGSMAFIHNNTFTNSEQSVGGFGYTIGLSCRSQALRVGNCTGGLHSSNNIFYNIGGQEYPYYMTNASTPVHVEDHNLFWNTRINCSQMTPPQAGGVGDRCGEDPLLVTPVLNETFDGHLRTPHSPAVGVGMAVSAVTTDIAGRSRPKSPAIGAYEFAGTPPTAIPSVASVIAVNRTSAADPMPEATTVHLLNWFRFCAPDQLRKSGGRKALSTGVITARTPLVPVCR